MVLKILLALAIILQFFAAGVALKLTRVTKYNLSWILITIGLIFMAFQRLVEFVPTVSKVTIVDPKDIFVWVGVVTSLCFAIGVFLIQKIFNYIKRSEQERRRVEKKILKAIIQTEEKERQRFAKDLHDGLGPLLSTVKMAVSSLSQMEVEESQKEIIVNTDMVINEAIRSLKEISNNLSPHILDNFGLTRALWNFINKLNISKGIEVAFETNLKNERFDHESEVILYRVVCELINNTIKHAKATKININMKLEDDQITIIFADNGIGFNPDIVLKEPRRGMGYSNIISRINSLKGEFNIESAPRNGTKVFIKVNARQS
ncbi:MAG: ATP-binding protein [Bacteroidota bacterium]|nr:ATP-binding protein [Bacteroidota bacterium]MDP4205641.1 ATP-binding protein [Bacteroidota bacterium]